MSILTMKNIYKSFDQTTALNNVNFEVSKGEIFGFLGPSGAGKTDRKSTRLNSSHH